MKRTLSIACLALLSTLTGFSQQTIELTYTAIDSASYVQLDSIKVMNRTRGGDTTLYWNDTVLVLSFPVGLPDINSRKDGFELHSYPNPVTDQATIEISLPEQGEMKLRMTDVLGRQLLEISKDLQPGTHTFKFMPGSKRLYLLTVMWNGYHKTIKIVNSASSPGRECTISYQGYDDVVATEEASEAKQGFTFELGDELLYIGYVDTLESGLLDIPDTSQTYTFQFAYNIPCPGTPTLDYGGKVYNTVQIFSQCWLKENLNVGTMIPGNIEMQDNDTIEKYCYDELPPNCDDYGGLYQWDEMMQYELVQSSQGICPREWHIPTDEEWKILTGSIDSQYGIGDYEWDVGILTGYDAGLHLKSQDGWLNGGNGTDLYGFTALPNGVRWWYINFSGVRGMSSFWTSTEYDDDIYAWRRRLVYFHNEVARYISTIARKKMGKGVRCVKD